jgi:hypothetical protein
MLECQALTSQGEDDTQHKEGHHDVSLCTVVEVWMFLMGK